MIRTLLMMLSLTLAAPFAFADQSVLGVPDVTCQDSTEWYLHDYGAPATGSLAFLPQDGNLNECSPPYSTWLDPNGDGCATLNMSETAAIYNALCVMDRPADWDGDYEFMFGGAVLASETGDSVFYGSLACWDMIGHHPQGGNVKVTNAVTLNVAFWVTADYWNPGVPLSPPTPDCGDGIIQPCDPTPPDPSGLPYPTNAVVDSVTLLLYRLLNEPYVTCNPLDNLHGCLNSCVPPFGPGIDGTYMVFVGPSLADGPGGTPTVATFGHIEL